MPEAVVSLMKPYYDVTVSRCDPTNDSDIEYREVGSYTQLADAERLANDYVPYFSWAVITKVEPYQDSDDGVPFINHRTLEVRNYRPEGDVFVLDDVTDAP